MPEDLIERTDDGPVRILTMTYRPYNLIGPLLIGALLQALSDAVGEGKRAILLRSGSRHFCAGADVGLFNDRIDAEGRGVRAGALARHGIATSALHLKYESALS